MNKIKMSLRLFLASLSLFVTSPLFAGNQAGNFTLDPAVGYFHFADKRKIDDNVMPNISIGYNASKHWGVEAFLGSVHSTTATAQQNVEGRITDFSGVYHFNTEHKWQPYLLAGVGLLRLVPSGNDATYQTHVDSGIGLQYFFNQKIAFNLGARDFYTFAGGKNDVLANFGVTVLFGGG